jgi:hypothetical protein
MTIKLKVYEFKDEPEFKRNQNWEEFMTNEFLHSQIKEDKDTPESKLNFAIER